MSFIRIDFSNIEVQSITLGATQAEAIAAINKEMERRGINAKDVHRACEERLRSGHAPFCPSYQTISKFLGGRGTVTAYEVVAMIVAAIGYEITGSTVFVEGEAVKVQRDDAPYAKPLVRTDKTANFKGKRGSDYRKKLNIQE